MKKRTFQQQQINLYQTITGTKNIKCQRQQNTKHISVKETSHKIIPLHISLANKTT
jgi:hypothetical protein